MRPKSPRIAVRAVIVEDERLLMVNAWHTAKSALMCAPGGGVEVGSSLPDNLAREVHEETGLTVEVGAPCLVNEYHDPPSQFHQVEVFFRCTIVPGTLRPEVWHDAEAVVTERRWLTEEELSQVPHKPDSLGAVAFGGSGVSYDPIEPLMR
ncbi:NUDIX hydrolase [Tateyamaria omphalii]|uniref:NUDIX domain-containing protein n=1 Tax=Tateyamaria omphalii TaxID=299262 RepID=UPI001677D6AB|nr:NUDIX domain-containing protein [Tateyamaria omphalii]GGX54002.1 NUDIX hydrolase [Tateyamaria omphalii]